MSFLKFCIPVIFFATISIDVFAVVRPSEPFWKYKIDDPNLTLKQADERCVNSLTMDTWGIGKWCRKAKELGSESADEIMLLHFGDSIKHFQINLEKAKQGDAIAAEAVGHEYFLDLVVAKDESKTMYWYEKSYAGRNVSAGFRLANFYLHFSERYQNPKRGIEILNELAELPVYSGVNGVSEQQFRARRKLAVLYLKGDVVKNNLALAWYYFERAYSNRKYDSYEIGYMYFHGLSVDKNIAESKKHFSRKQSFEAILSSKEQFHPEALYYLGLMKYKGLEAPQDLAMAYSLFKLSSEGLYNRYDWTEDLDPEFRSHMYYLLGYMSEMGVGTDKDISLAKYYYERSQRFESEFSALSAARISKL
ncbi:sel1 repeat family protein [Vibrio sp. S9_S30]|uniref:SEL1-like repeat protein n=1 Tax=Vibrio sp. S9_S30 TaxID=2720226 RepID=UPI00167FFA7D|nr:tetratricopeptide repeat protein [Vibrio sp. S9_S30]MBD1555666.1 sel1 repeat family protein [Vibrio sp. S9_S30]